jgi:uncharacterized YccA/Bax inhibitor family protein
MPGLGSPLLTVGAPVVAADGRREGEPLTPARVSRALAVLLAINGMAVVLAITGFQAALDRGGGFTVDQVVNIGFGAGVFSFGLAFATAFRRPWAPLTAPVYAAGSAVFAVGLAFGFEQRFPGIAQQSVLVTLGIVAACAALYGFGVVRPSDRFRFAVYAATVAVGFVYLASFLMSFAGMRIPLIHEAGIGGILWTGFIVTLASLNLLIDFQRIDRMEGRPAPAWASWYTALGVMVTMVWLYISVLRLLGRIRR